MGPLLFHFGTFISILKKQGTGKARKYGEIAAGTNMAKVRPMKDVSIYILDDDVYYGRCMQKKLQRAFPNVKHFKTERNFVKALEDEPEVVILDHVLEKKYGLNVMDEMSSKGVNTHVLYVSSQDQVHVTLSAYQKGALAYFEKNASTFQDVLVAIRWISVISNNFTLPVNGENFRKKLLQTLG